MTSAKPPTSAAGPGQTHLGHHNRNHNRSHTHSTLHTQPQLHAQVHSYPSEPLGLSHSVHQPHMQAGPSSIRSYRSKKIRPCDNCRSRRQRCDIPRAGEACRLCVVTKKQCTFLRERRKAPSDLKKLAEREAELIAQMQGGGAGGSASASANSLLERPTLSHHTSGDSAKSALTNPTSAPSSPEPSSGTCLAHLTSYILSTRCSPLLVTEPVALDTEGEGDDEELHLVGTASERDALILSTMTESASPGSGVVQLRSIPGVRLRTVAPDVHFVFYKIIPYGNEPSDESTWVALRDMVTPALVPTVLQAFFHVEAEGHPILRRQVELQLYSATLRCFILTAGLMYIPQLRRLHKEAYNMCMSSLRAQAPRVRLWTLQVYLLDLDGREGIINPSGSFITLGLAISTALLLGLHQDCGSWSIPGWEKELRTRLWWSLLNYDRFSSLTFGRSRSIVTPNRVPQPPRTAGDTASYDAFVSVCELGVILDDLDSPTASLASLVTTSMRLDAWKNAADSRGLFTAESAAPGVRSAQLLYIGSCVMVVRNIFDSLDAGETDSLEAARHSCLLACEGVVNFVAGLTPGDLYGYWTCHSPFMLSLTLTMLVRIIIDSAEVTVRESGLYTLRRLTSILIDHQNAGWDVAQLALARAQYFIPLLTRGNPEFNTVLETAQQNGLLSEPADGALAEFLHTLVDPSGLHEFADGSMGNLFNVSSTL